MTAHVILADNRHGLTSSALSRLGPRLAQRPDVGVGRYVVLMALPVLVAALARLPVGVLTDRYGARVTFPAVSLLAAASVFGLALTDSLPVVVVAGGTAGVGLRRIAPVDSVTDHVGVIRWTRPYSDAGVHLGHCAQLGVVGMIGVATVMVATGHGHFTRELPAGLAVAAVIVVGAHLILRPTLLLGEPGLRVRWLLSSHVVP